MNNGATYILASRRNGTFYIGITSNLIRRVHEHKTDVVAGFTRRYGVHQLVWYEQAESILSAIERKKELKNLSREEKLALIERDNPHWKDLYWDLL